MPSKSKSQQRLFGMALAVRRGELRRSEVGKEVLDIVDGDMTDKEIRDFAKERTSDKEHNVKESCVLEEMSDEDKRLITAKKNGSTLRTNPSKKDPSLTPIENYLNNLRYAGRMKPLIEVRPETNYVFIVIKPGFCKLANTVIERFEESGFSLYKTHSKLLTEREAKKMYYTHKDEDFYDSLCKYMASDTSIGILFTYPSNWNQDKAFKKTDEIKDEIRKKFQESDMRNVMHSSDSAENMRAEAAKYFNELI